MTSSRQSENVFRRYHRHILVIEHQPLVYKTQLNYNNTQLTVCVCVCVCATCSYGQGTWQQTTQLN